MNKQRVTLGLVVACLLVPPGLTAPAAAQGPGNPPVTEEVPQIEPQVQTTYRPPEEAPAHDEDDEFYLDQGQGTLPTGPGCGSQPPPTYPSACPSGTDGIAPGVCHPHPQPRPRPSCQETTDCPDCFTRVDSGSGVFPAMNPWNYRTFPGNNFLPNVYTNMFDGDGNEMINTLPSTPDVPYNLHEGAPEVRTINRLSPEDDLEAILERVAALAEKLELLASGGSGQSPAYDAGEAEVAAFRMDELLAKAVDIIEGEPVEDRAYSGFPLLHYTGPEKVRAVRPVFDRNGEIVGGEVTVNQIWYGQHIESDTAFIDASPILVTDGDGNVTRSVPWVVKYHVHVLSRGRDDFSPFVTYVDPFAPGPDGTKSKKPHVGMDQTFFPMKEGTVTTFRIKMAPPQYLNLVYTWGWRSHPPRIQVMENALKKINYNNLPHPMCPDEYEGLTLPEIEKKVFCPASEPDCHEVRCHEKPRFDPVGNPTACERRKLDAIAKIGELSPAKRMWRHFLSARAAAVAEQWTTVRHLMVGAEPGEASFVDDSVRDAYLDWIDRTRLPKGVEVDPDADMTILYANNTIYGELTDGGIVRWDEWEERPQLLKVTAYNDDRFPHSYTIADFGGNRGWENQFKSSVKVAGSGCWFTFGRAHWWMPVGAPNGFLCVGEGDAAGPARHRFEVRLNFEPSRRLRFYQFDPMHHDVAIFSVH